MQLIIYPFTSKIIKTNNISINGFNNRNIYYKIIIFKYVQ